MILYDKFVKFEAWERLISIIGGTGTVPLRPVALQRLSLRQCLRRDRRCAWQVLYDWLSFGCRSGQSRQEAIAKASTNRNTSSGRRACAVRSTRLRTLTTSNTRARRKKTSQNPSESTSSSRELVNIHVAIVTTVFVLLYYMYSLHISFY